MISGFVASIAFAYQRRLRRTQVCDSPWTGQGGRRKGDVSRSAGMWLSHSAKSIRLALGLLPFAGIAFLWFMGATGWGYTKTDF